MSFFDKKSKGCGVNIPSEVNEQLAKELHKPINRNFKKKTVSSGFRDNIWSADIQLIRKFNKGFRFLLCVIDICSKHAWVVPLKDERGVSIVNAFQKKNWMIQIENQTKYGSIKEANFTIVFLKNV